jgi:hypothetical protein
LNRIQFVQVERSLVDPADGFGGLAGHPGPFGSVAVERRLVFIRLAWIIQVENALGALFEPTEEFVSVYLLGFKFMENSLFLLHRHIIANETAGSGNIIIQDSWGYRLRSAWNPGVPTARR